jgi:hypothetical protein
MLQLCQVAQCGAIALLWNAVTGKLLASVKPPGRDRPSWTLPIALMFLWAFEIWGLARMIRPEMTTEDGVSHQSPHSK